jgi:hypothetical protein
MKVKDSRIGRGRGFLRGRFRPTRTDKRVKARAPWRAKRAVEGA